MILFCVLGEGGVDSTAVSVTECWMEELKKDEIPKLNVECRHTKNDEVSNTHMLYVI